MLLILFVALSALLFTACSSDPPEVVDLPPYEMEKDAEEPEFVPEFGPNGFRMIHLTEEARDIALADFDYLVEIILENAPTQGIVYRRFGVTLEEYLGFVREHIYEMIPMESFTSLILDERWDTIPNDPLYIAADYLNSLLLIVAVFELDQIGHFGPLTLESYESMFLGNSVILYDPEAADFTGDIRSVERVIGYFSAPNTLWFYGTDPSEFDLYTDLSVLGTRHEDNLTI